MREDTTIGDALKRYLRTSGLNILLKNQAVMKAWGKVVGPEIAAQTRIVGLKRGTLTVEVASSGLYAELSSFYLDDLVKSLREETGSGRIRKIRLRLGELVEEPGDGIEENGG
jgi:hypothetical protein